MAIVLWAMDRQETHEFAPMRELSDAHKREVYQAAGDELHDGLEALGEGFDARAGCFLLQLSDKTFVSFPFTIGAIEEVNS